MLFRHEEGINDKELPAYFTEITILNFHKIVEIIWALSV